MATAAIAEQSGDRPAAEGWYTFKLVALFSVGWAVFTGAIMMLSPLLPLIREEFQLSGAQAGLLTSVFYLPYLLMQLPAGLLADRIGPKRLLVGMTLFCAATLAGIGLFAVTLAPLVVFGVLYRAGSGTFYPTAFGITANAVPRARRGVSSAALTGGMALGTGLGLAVAVPLAQLGGTWRFPFLVVAGVTVVLALLFFRTLKPGQRLSSGRGGGLGQALRDPSLWLLYAGGTCANFGFTVLATWGPSFLSAERGVSLAMAGFLTSLFSFIGCPAGFVVGRCSDALGRRPLSVVLFAASAASLAGVALAPHAGLITLAIVAYGLTGKWAKDGALTAWVGDMANGRYPAATGSVFGLNNMFRMMGGMAAPPVAGALLDLTGTLQTGLLAGAAALAFGAVLILLAREGGR